MVLSVANPSCSWTTNNIPSHQTVEFLDEVRSIDVRLSDGDPIHPQRRFHHTINVLLHDGFFSQVSNLVKLLLVRLGIESTVLLDSARTLE